MSNTSGSLIGSVDKECLTTECPTRRWIIEERDWTFALMQARLKGEK